MFLFTVLFLFSAPLLTGQKSINTLKRIKYENEIDIFLFFLAFLFSACEDDFDYLYSGPYNEREEWVPLDRTIAAVFTIRTSNTTADIPGKRLFTDAVTFGNLLL